MAEDLLHLRPLVGNAGTVGLECHELVTEYLSPRVQFENRKSLESREHRNFNTALAGDGMTWTMPRRASASRSSVMVSSMSAWACERKTSVPSDKGGHALVVGPTGG